MIRGGAAGQGAADTAVTPVVVELVDRHGHGTRIAAELRYFADDPYAVAVVLPTDGGPVVWRFARDLLEQGAFAPIGDGDVHVWPSLSCTGVAVVLVELRGAGGRSVHLELPARAVLHFLGASHAVVARGAETPYVDLDGLVEELLNSAG